MLRSLNLHKNQAFKLTMNNKRFSRNIILFFIITGWLRVLAIVIPSVWIYMNTGNWREQTNTEQTTINSTNDNIPTLKIE